MVLPELGDEVARRVDAESDNGNDCQRGYGNHQLDNCVSSLLTHFLLRCVGGGLGGGDSEFQQKEHVAECLLHHTFGGGAIHR